MTSRLRPRRWPRLARKISLLLDDLDETLLAVRGVGTARRGEVSVACVPPTVYLLSPVIDRYRERFPKLRLKIFDACANEVLAAVSRGGSDSSLPSRGGACDR